MRGLHAKRLRVLSAGLVVIGAMSLSACAEVEEESAAGYEPAKLEPIKGKSEDYQRVTFTKEGAARTDLQTGVVSRTGGQKAIPYEALIYNDEAKTFTYVSTKPLSYERVPITVDRIVGDRVVLSKGPAVGTKVVTVGASEVYGAELDIAGSH